MEEVTMNKAKCKDSFKEREEHYQSMDLVTSTQVQDLILVLIDICGISGTKHLFGVQLASLVKQLSNC